MLRDLEMKSCHASDSRWLDSFVRQYPDSSHDINCTKHLTIVRCCLSSGILCSWAALNLSDPHVSLWRRELCGVETAKLIPGLDTTEPQQHPCPVSLLSPSPRL